MPELERRALVAVLCLCGVTLVPYVALGFFNHPTADDYAIAARVGRDGFAGGMVSWYRECNGRFTPNALSSLLYVVGGFGWLYRVLPLAMFVGTVAALQYMIRGVWPALGRAWGWGAARVAVCARAVPWRGADYARHLVVSAN